MKKILGILILTAICCINLTADLNEGLVVNFQFNGNLNDESGNGNNGDYVGSPIFTEDRFGNENSSISFDGDDAVRIYETQGLEFSSDSSFTFVAWYRSDTSFENRYSLFLSNTPHVNDKHFYLGVLAYAGYPPDKFLKFSFGGEGDQSTTDDYYQFTSNIGTDELNNNWHLVVGIHNGETGIMQLYIDGTLDNTYSIQAQGIYTDNTDWVLGTFYSRGGTTTGYPTSLPWYEGDLDDVRIYNRAITEDEVLQLYQGVNFTVSETSIYIGEEIQFNDTSFGNPITWEWDFENDGIFDSFIQHPTHIYEAEGIYNVKLKISNGTFVDSLIKENLIDVTYCPPASPTLSGPEISGNNAIISWTSVDTTDCGSAITPDGYVIQYSEVSQDSAFYYLWSVPNTQTSFTHIDVTRWSDAMFYKVFAFKDYNNRQIEYLESLNNSREKIKWSEVKQNLEKRK